ncbi:thermonuclease family protein [Bacillus alkalicellulosilyticus]|uniref:thermonuclease family protein n=1 Tax=Alkalihalobacterium alkalicellulosilyticum TaxID=1912214 RepID=UPI000998081B|nr:thermonuclease family protein [Bacillus alkalicellulosilyticus]
MKKYSGLLFFIIIIMVLSTFSTVTEAHRGSLDKLGGHFRNADCTYLLHKPTDLAKTAKNKEELVQLVKKHSSNKCKDTLTAKKIDTEGYTFSNSKSSTPKSGKIALNKKYTATLVSCIDGDTAKFKVNGKTHSTRFLFIDTPESTKKVEKFGKEASEFTCKRLKKASKIVLETDGKDVYDKYDRLLAWVHVDDKLLQEQITKAGLVKGFYDYGDYKYEKKIRDAMKKAKKDKVGMYK